MIHLRRLTGSTYGVIRQGELTGNHIEYPFSTVTVISFLHHVIQTIYPRGSRTTVHTFLESKLRSVLGRYLYLCKAKLLSLCHRATGGSWSSSTLSRDFKPMVIQVRTVRPMRRGVDQSCTTLIRYW